VHFTKHIPLFGMMGKDPRVQEVVRNPATTAAMAGVGAEPCRRVTVQELTRCILSLSLLLVDGTNYLLLFFPSPENQKAVHELVESQQK